MHEQIAEREARLSDTRTGVVAVASGPGMVRLFSELGAHVIDGGPTMNPSTKDLLRGIEAAGTDEIVLMPNSKNVAHGRRGGRAGSPSARCGSSRR